MIMSIVMNMVMELTLMMMDENENDDIDEEDKHISKSNVDHRSYDDGDNDL